MSTFLRDCRLALRSMMKRRTLSTLLVVTLGLGLGSNIAMFSMFDVLLVRPLNFPNVDRLVRVWEVTPTSDAYDRSNASPADFLDWKAQTGDTFESVVAMEDWDANLRASDTPERVQAFKVSPEYFETLGIKPVLGRGFRAEEGEPGKDGRAVLSYGLWQRTFAGNPKIIGTETLIDGKSYTVVGIAPRGFDFPQGSEIWVPLAFDAATSARRDQRYLTVVALLKSGSTVEEAATLMTVVSQRIEVAHPDTNKSYRARVQTISRGFEDVALRSIMGFFLAGTGLVLLIACVNLGNFLLAQGSERRREVALRQALGASRSRIVRQLLTEGLVTALLSLVVAIPVAAVATHFVREFMPLELIRFVTGWQSIGVDGRAVLFGAILAIISAGIFALAPARSTVSSELTEALKEGGRAATAGGSRQRGRNLLVTSQIATALAIVVVGSLASKSATSFIDGPQGYDPENMLGARLSLPEATYATPESRVQFERSVRERLKRLPAVESVSGTNILPARGSNSSRSIRVEGAPPVDRALRTSADSRAISPEYFDTLRIPIVAGRGITENDMSTSAPLIAVVSQSFARKYWPGQEAIGRKFQAGDADDAPMLTVVGISGDIIHQWFGRRNHPTYFRPYAQDPRGDFSFAIRTRGGDPENIVQDVRREIAAIDPYQPAYELWSMRRSLMIGTVGIRFVAAIMTALSGLALMLALSGVYGVMAYRVSLRTLEVGIRRALGATSRDVLRLTMDQAARLTMMGLAIGALLGVAMGRGLSSLMAGALSVDPATVAGTALLIGGAALLAAYVPARRSLSIEPTRALRAE